MTDYVWCLTEHRLADVAVEGAHINVTDADMPGQTAATVEGFLPTKVAVEGEASLDPVHCCNVVVYGGLDSVKFLSTNIAVITSSLQMRTKQVQYQSGIMGKYHCTNVALQLLGADELELQMRSKAAPSVEFPIARVAEERFQVLMDGAYMPGQIPRFCKLPAAQLTFDVLLHS